MRQVVQYQATGKIETMEVPEPALQPGGVLVHTAFSVLSPGTERASLEFGQQSLAQKALRRPDMVRRVLQRAWQDGIPATVREVHQRVNRPSPMGYSSAGVVLQVGEGVQGFRPGDRVACAGSQYACHADVAFVPQNLAVPVPAGVPLDHAAFATIGAIVMQGVRVGQVSLGERVAVVGLGLVGQLTVQIARAAGARVLAVDLDPFRVELARSAGAEVAVLRSEAEAAAAAFSEGYGVDMVLLTAATQSNDPINLAAAMAREKGLVIVVGDVGLAVPREPFYAKELELRLSRSYGPGRYDPIYEEEGIDYPYSYVRWTERRNMASFLELVASGRVTLGPLITHRFPVTSAAEAYLAIQGEAAGRSVGVVLEYDTQRPSPARIAVSSAAPPSTGSVKIGMVGAGSFARSTLLPAIKADRNTALQGVITGSGLTAAAIAREFGFGYCASSTEELLRDPGVNCIVIATRHNLHSQQVVAALEAGKDVFVEKPLAITEAELAAIAKAHHQAGRRLMVGFNRRFAPLAVRMREFLAGRHAPLVMTYRVNAGRVPPNHWTQDPAVGGGRIIGEACHFVDLLGFLAGALPVSVYAQSAQHLAQGRQADDEVTLAVAFADGSIGNVVYAAGGDATYPKERLEVFGDGRTAVLDDFRTLELSHHGRKETVKGKPPGDKGHRAEWRAFAEAIQKGGPSPLPFEEAVAATLATFRAMESIRSGKPEPVNMQGFPRDAMVGAQSNPPSA
ncbi:MAG: bi-domain-containing oxidoreductase [Chloroflexi bacterium]|nr:bi-domain-containing oxidoreductase [Chloroflexota bacterium]